MANIILQLKGATDAPTGKDETLEKIGVGPQGACSVLGKKGTFQVLRSGEDAVASVGYVSLLGGQSGQDSLSRILDSFDESRIGDLKRELVGQYVLLVKRGDRIWLFSDFMGARNVFYSNDGLVVSSSLSRIEDLIHTGPADLDPYKFTEFLAVKHVLYPAWLGSTTMHKRIRLLYPYEYIAVDTATSSFRVGSVVFSVDNRKETDRSILSDDLLCGLRSVIDRPEFKDAPVAATLSGGRDSRLVAGLATEYYDKVHFRIAVAPGHHDSLKDMEVAETLAKAQGVPLDVYRFQPGRDETRFQELTEGMAPSFNNKLAPLLDDTGAYALGFGGVFGTELFMPLPWSSIDEFVRVTTDRAKVALKVEEGFWKSFGESMREEFRRIKRHYLLSENDERDYIRLFILLDTARYGSFIISAFNHSGYQLEPYGAYPVFSLAFRVAPALWGNHRRFGGDARVQLAAMARLNPRMARVLTYKNYRPMMPLSAGSFARYVWGAALQGKDVLRRRFEKGSDSPVRISFALGQYLSGEWAESFFQRTKERYGMSYRTES
jgi:hypothetical protein